MTNWYEVGKMYIWQNQVGEFAPLNGKETTVLECVTSVTFLGSFKTFWGQETDTILDGEPIMAERGDLRPKNPPPGEQSVTDLFKLTEPELV